MKPATTPPSKPRPKGLAVLSPEKRKEIARLGGIASHKLGKGHQWSSKEATEAGRAGGIASNGGKGKGSRKNPKP